MGVIKIKNNSGDWVKLPNYGVVLEGGGAIPEVDLSNYYTKEETWDRVTIDDKISTAIGNINMVLDGINGEVV